MVVIWCRSDGFTLTPYRFTPNEAINLTSGQKTEHKNIQKNEGLALKKIKDLPASF